LQGEHPDDLRVVEVKCMAACRQSPAVMVDYDFYPNVTPEELYGVVNAKLATETPLATELEDMLVS
jgi:NADH:ubiquinone oxidoreductase subunit E